MSHQIIPKTDVFYIVAQLRVHVDAGLQLHRSRHLGSNLEV